MFKRIGILKEFGPDGHKVVEEVSAEPSLGTFKLAQKTKQDIFSLRIDADEYSKESFKKYYPVFEKFKDAITIFFSVNSFKDSPEEILKCRDMGCEIQSHGYYHYTYSDYQSNRYNINKAKIFFLGLGIETHGFVSPSGRWSPALMRALEDEGYVYSSEFSYDYMGYPNYPYLGRNYSKILQIPVFPIAPELFFRDLKNNIKIVNSFYKKAIDELIKNDLPVIIYAHTDPNMPEVPQFLDDITEYAINKKGLKPLQMSAIYDNHNKIITSPEDQKERVKHQEKLKNEFLGRPVNIKLYNVIKEGIKNLLDYETITPSAELKCKKVRKMLKLFARAIAEKL